MKEIGVVQWRRGSGLNQNQVLSVIEYYYLRLGLREIRGGAMSSKKFRRKTMTEKYNERRKAILKAERTKPRCALPE